MIPNSVETDIFVPLNKRLAKEELGINPDCTTLMFGVLNAGERRKGFKDLIEAMQFLLKNSRYQELANSGKLAINLIGATEGLLKDIPVKIHNFGSIRDDRPIARIYSASDVFILPSHEDNLPNTMLEAMACGTPVIGFSVGGIPDMVKHRETGLLVDNINYVALSNAINEAVSSPELLQEMSVTAADLIRREYTQGVQATKYASLFNKLKPVSSSPAHDVLSYEELVATFG